jgi:hypothetical protein
MAPLLVEVAMLVLPVGVEVRKCTSLVMASVISTTLVVASVVSDPDLHFFLLYSTFTKWT